MYIDPPVFPCTLLLALADQSQSQLLARFLDVDDPLAKFRGSELERYTIYCSITVCNV